MSGRGCHACAWGFRPPGMHFRPVRASTLKSNKIYGRAEALTPVNSPPGCSPTPQGVHPRVRAKGTKEWEDDIAFIKTTYDISLDFGKSLLPRGFSPA